MKHPVITISREFGSGGRQIGEEVAGALGLKFYDKSLIDLVAQKSDYSPDFVAENDQRITKSMLFQMAINSSVPPWFNAGKAIVNHDTLYSTQSQAIRELAAQGGCVIVGRCADYVLRDVPGQLSVFVSGRLEDKIRRCITDYNIHPDAAPAEIRARDQDRAEYYSHYTGGVWGAAKNYDIAVNSSKFGIKDTVALILMAAKNI
ncbi:MAG: AAA family ATPase [Candidatus Fimivivens sp.]